MTLASSEEIKNSLTGQNIISTQTLNKDQLKVILETASEMEAHIKNNTTPKCLEGKILATLFFEPSTRTRLSFEAAMFRLGDQVITVEQGNSSSSVKGESLQDTGRVVSEYADIIVMRHPEPGSVSELSSKSRVPVINAGDGPNEHPTQALLDLYTIYSEKQTLDGLKVGFLGDLKHGRTVHSLVKLLRHYDVEFVFISHPDIAIPKEITEIIKESNCTYSETEDIEAAIKDLDVLYATRIQKERFQNNEDYEKQKDKYKLTQTLLDSSVQSLRVLHPLPRVNEISPEIDDDPKARYFKQAENGIYLRMALLALVLGK